MSETGQKIIAEIRKQAQAKPDFVYSPPIEDGDCFYVYQGAPSCIVGQALWALGLIDGSLEKDKGAYYNDLRVDSLFGQFLKLAVDEDELRWIWRVQAYQDRKDSWSVAVARADKNAEEDEQ